MSYTRQIFENRVPVYFESRKAAGRPDMWNDVILPTLLAWALFFIGSLGLSFVIVSAKLVPTFDEILTMIGIAFGVSAISTLFPFGVMYDKYQMRIWSVEVSEYETPEPQESGARIWQQTGNQTINRTRVKWTRLQLHDLALRFFDADGRWTVDNKMARDQLAGIMPNVERKYRTIQKDFIDLGWIIPAGGDTYRWTERGKEELWRYYPPTRN